MNGDTLVASHVASGDTPVGALGKITGRAISARELQTHWFRVVDQSEGTVLEYSDQESTPA